MRKHLLAALLLSLFALAPRAAATVDVTANLKTLATGNVTRDAYLLFELKNCGGNQPRVNGVALVDNSVIKRPDVNGLVSVTLYSNNEITCGNSTSTHWTITYMRGGAPVAPGRNYTLPNGTANLNSLQPDTVLPTSAVLPLVVLKNPGGTQQIIQPSATTLLVNSFENIRFADGFANIQAAFTDAGTTGAVVVPPNYAGTDGFTNPNAIPFFDFRAAARSVANVKHFGATGNGRATTNAVTVASNTTLTNTTDSPWVAGDVGKTIVLHSQTYSPGLVTTISAFTDSSHIVLADAPTSSTTVNAVWGTDDSAAVTAAFAAITAKGSVGQLYFPQGIYLVGTSLSVVNAQGLTISGAGAASMLSLGNYNATGQPATGTALVWVGAQGGVIGCPSNTGAPPAGVDDALTNCTAAENVMLKLSGQFNLRDLSLNGSQRVSHNLQIGGAETSSSFTWSMDRVNSGYAWQYGLVIGGTGANQGSNFGEASITNVSIGGNGIPNTTVAENDATGGGDIFVRIGPGNFQIKFNAGFIGGGSGVNGSHRVFHYAGNFLSFDNVYFSPLVANGTIHSSVYAKAGNFFSFTNSYDENGYMIHSAGGDVFHLSQVQMRQQSTTKPHVAAVFDASSTVDLNTVGTAGLPIVFKAGGKVARNNVTFGNFGTGPAYPATLCAGAGCITRSGSTVTVTTTATHPYVAGDWVALSGIADATYNGVFAVVAPVTGTTFDVINAAASGATTEGGTAGLACCVVSETATSYIPQYNHPFINYLEGQNNSGTLADQLASTATNIAHKNAITIIPGSIAGAVGSSMPATIPAGWHYLDMRGGTPTFLGGPYTYGTAANPVTVSVSKFQIAGAAASNAILQGDGTNFVSVTPTGTGVPVLVTSPQFTATVGIGQAAVASTMLMGATSTLAGATQNGISSRPTFSGSATTSARSYQSFPSTQAAAFTLPNLYHYEVIAPTIGGGSAVTTQYGFYCPALTGAGTNWCLYNAGAAGNLLGTGLTTIGALKVAGTAPTCTFTSGGGTTPSCALATGSTDSAGTIIATTGTGSPGTAGTITLTFSAALGTNKPSCTYALSNDGAGTWNVRATVIDETPSTTSDLFNWDNNSVALGVSTAFHVNYHCIAK